MSQFKYQIFPRYNGASWVSDVYENGICINPNAPTYFLSQFLTPNPWNTSYNPSRKIVLISKYGLSGGGNSSPKGTLRDRSTSVTNKIPEKTHFTSSTRELASSVKNTRNPSVVFMDDRKDYIIKKLLLDIKSQIKSGLEFSYIIKQIEDFNFLTGINCFLLCNSILEILSLPQIYIRKKWAFHREKLSRLAKKLMIFHIAFSGEGEQLVTGAYEEAKVWIGAIDKHIENNNKNLTEVGFQVNIACINLLIEALRKDEIKEHLLAKNLTKVVEDFVDMTNSERSVNEYLRASVKASRNFPCDLILLEFLGAHENKSSIIRNLIDMNCSSPWLNLAAILDYVQESFSPVDSIQLLSEYLYYSSFETGSWKIQSRAIELITQLSIQNPNFISLTTLVISEKAKIPCELSIKTQLIHIDLYKTSISEYISNSYKAKDLFIPKSIPKWLQNLEAGRETEDLIMILNNSGYKTICITGKKGTGKTSLALTYYKTRRNFYKKLIFIRATNRGVLENSFIKISKKLGIIEQETIDEVIKSVVRFLNKSDEMFLIIFDDVKDLAGIKGYFPTRGHIILTSEFEVFGLRYEVSEPSLEVLIKYLEKTKDSKGIADRCLGDWHIGKLYRNISDKKKCVPFVAYGQSLYEKICEDLCNIQGIDIVLQCLGLLENFPLQINYAKKVLEKASKTEIYDSDINIEVTLCKMSDWGLVYEKKNFYFMLEPNFHSFLSKSYIKNPDECAKILSELYLSIDFSIYTKDLNAYYYGRLLENCHILNSQNLNCVGILLFVRGLYYLYHIKNFISAIDDFTRALNMFDTLDSFKEKTFFLLGRCYLYTNQIKKAISLLENISNSLSDPELTLYSKVYLIKSYEIIGQGVKIRNIIFNKSSSLSTIQFEESALYIIHGICRLFLTEKKLKNLITPYSLFLHSNTPSILLLETLWKLSLFFEYKERWTTVLAYINLIAQTLGVHQVLQPGTMRSAMDSIINLVFEIKVKTEDLLGENHYTLSYAYIILAKVHATLGINDLRIKNLDRALEIRTKKYGPDQLCVAEVQLEIAKYYGIKVKSIDLAYKYIKKAEKTIKATAGESTIIYARVIDLKGLILAKDNQLTEATNLINQSFAIKNCILAKSSDNEEMSQSFASLGLISYKKHELQQALDYYTKALEPNHKIYLSTFWALKAYKIALELHSYQQALEFKNQQIRLLIHIYDANSEIVFNEYQKAYQLAIDIKSYEQANNIALGSLDILKGMSNKNTLNYNQSMYMIKVADSFTKIRKYDDAENYLKDAVDLAKKDNGIKSFEYTNAKYALGIFYKDMGKYAKAIDQMESVVEDLTGKRKGKILVDIGLCYMKIMKVEKAKGVLDSAMKIYNDEGLKLEVGKVYVIFSYLYKDNALFMKKSLKKAIEIYSKELGSEHTETIHLCSRLNSLKSLSSTSLI
ncbi:hypothetical protein SteCoe_30446 [Stentor coeruleus]|uniref:NB-ARC domain-containing protein n=1 Tax=Stentor coeruleus TaxID=5963 RepID=A0A1R2B3J8_9CILI|nr:hypothetical protein SteCoe_30446 [Stentor coeruleus]